MTQAIPLHSSTVIERANKALRPERKLVMRDGTRVVLIDLSTAKDIDLEKFARSLGPAVMAPYEKIHGAI